MGYIYKIVNDINNKIYVGMTRNTLIQRWKEHRNHYKDRDTHLYYAMRKYGIEHFQIIELEECLDEELTIREAYWINKLSAYENGYNMTEGKGEGAGNCFNARPVCQYDINGNFIAQYKSLSQAGQLTNTEAMNIRRAALHECNSAGGYQWRFVEDDTPVGKITLPKGGGRGKIVRQYSLEDEFIAEFPSARRAAASLNMAPTNIINCCNGKCQKAGGYKWKYKENEN